MWNRLIHIREPQLMFGGDQKTEDPRDGLLIFGPYERWGTAFSFNAFSVSAGVIGTREAYENYRQFVKRLKSPILSYKRNKRGIRLSNEMQRPSFPGFETVFNIQWPEPADIFLEIKPLEIYSILNRERNRTTNTRKNPKTPIHKYHNSTNI